MRSERKSGLGYSAAFHLIVLLLAIFGLPSFFKQEPPPEPAAITVELLPITGITNVKPSDATPAEQPKPQPKSADKNQPDEPKKQPEPKKPSPPVKSAAAPPPPADAVPLPKKDDKQLEKKPDAKPAPDPKKDDKPDPKKAKPEDLDAILKAVKDTAQKQQPKAQRTEAPKEKDAGSPTKSVSNTYDPSQQMSLSEKDAIMSQIAQCWSPPAGAKNAQDLVILVEAEYNSDGSLNHAELSSASEARASTDSFYRAAAESAMRAVKQCSPLKLPLDKYAGWKNMELNFDPRYMLQ